MNLCNPDLTYLYSTITYAYFNSIPYNSNLHHIYCSLTVNVGIPEFTKRHYRHNPSMQNSRSPDLQTPDLQTECFGAQEVDIYFLNNIFNLKRNCVLCTLKNSFAIFWAWRTYIHTYTHTHKNSLHLKRPKLGISLFSPHGVFWGPRGWYSFLWIIYLIWKGTACFARWKIASLFFGRDIHTHTHIHTYTQG